MSDLNVNQGSPSPINPLFHTEYTQEIGPSVSDEPRDGDTDTLSQAAVKGGKDITLPNDVFAVPNLFTSPTEVVAIPGAYIISSSNGQKVTVPSPSNNKDLIQAATQLIQEEPQAAAGGAPSILQYLKSISTAINMMEASLRDQGQLQTDKKLAQAKDPLMGYDDKSMMEELAKSDQLKATTNAAAAKTAAAGPPKGLNDLQSLVKSLVRDANVDPKIGDTMTLLGQLEFILNHPKSNVSGGFILGNYPQVAIALQKLGIAIPSNPNNVFSGLAERMSKENKPPYNTAEYKNFANSMPAGWEVVSKTDIENILKKVADVVKTQAGSAYGVLAKPLQNLFGTSLFALPLPPPSSELYKLIDMKPQLKQMLSDLKAGHGSLPEFKYTKLIQECVEYGILPPQYQFGMGIWSFGSEKVDIQQCENAVNNLQNKINSLGGENYAKTGVFPGSDRGGVVGSGMVASSALVGNFTSQLSSTLDQLFSTELSDSFKNSQLTPTQQQNVQQLASTSIMTALLGDVVHEQPVESDQQQIVENLKNSIAAQVNSGAAQNIVNTVFGQSGSGGGLSGFQDSIMKSITQSFMINIGVSTTVTSSGSASTAKQMNATLDSLKSNEALAKPASDAQAFLNITSSQLDNPKQFDTYLKTMSKQADSISESKLDEQETLRKMIKVLKEILAQLTTGGSLSKKLGETSNQMSETLGTSITQNTILPHNIV